MSLLLSLSRHHQPPPRAASCIASPCCHHNASFVSSRAKTARTATASVARVGVVVIDVANGSYIGLKPDSSCRDWIHEFNKERCGWKSFICSVRTTKSKNCAADVWSCGVTLYVMLVGTYPFEDPNEPKDFRKTIQRILSVQYSIPDCVQISQECRHLTSRIFVFDPAEWKAHKSST